MCAALLLAVSSWVGCTTTPTAPTSPAATPTPTPSQPVVNAPPVIQSITVGTTRAEVGQDVTLTAAVADAETPVDKLSFVWTAPVGQFSGSGATVTWRLPQGAAATPVDVAATLQVVEQYQDVDSAGRPITRENRVSADAAPIRVHDSPAEIATISIRFLVDYFGNSSVSPDTCLGDFSDNCRGKADERNDIEANRRNFVILSAAAHVDSIAFDSAMTSADVVAPCTFHDKRLDTGALGTSDGDCLLTAVYENRRWWLCESHFRSR